jgi:hypothetical protein
MRFFKQAVAPTERKKGQREDLHGSGIYPSSGPWPNGEAALRAPEDWNRRALGPSTDAPIKEKAKRARQGVRRRIKSDYDEGYSQGQVVEKSGPVEKALRTGYERDKLCRGVASNGIVVLF